MDQLLTLSYEGKAYTITVVDSTERYPHFYWCLVRDPLLMELLEEDCVAFQQKEGGLLYPTDFYQGKAQGLLDALKTLLVEQVIQPAADKHRHTPKKAKGNRNPL